MSEDFVKVANTNDIQPSHMKEVQLDGENICLVNVILILSFLWKGENS
jgi:glycine betaine catabolism B